jgi:hypothetical protein
VFAHICVRSATRRRRTPDALIVKRTLGHAGFSPEEFSGHSLRAGLATSAAEAGQQERDIMQQTRHKSEKMVRRYTRKGSLFQGNVVDALGFCGNVAPFSRFPPQQPKVALQLPFWGDVSPLNPMRSMALVTMRAKKIRQSLLCDHPNSRLLRRTE